MAGELVLPSYIDPKLLGSYKPYQRLRQRTALSRSGASPTLTDLYGNRTAKPRQPIFLFDARGRVTTILMPMGQTEVSELDDLIQEQREKKPFDFDVWRERKGLPPRDKAPALMQEAIQRRIDQHKRNPVTDPARVPQYADRTPTFALPERAWRS